MNNETKQCQRRIYGTFDDPINRSQANRIHNMVVDLDLGSTMDKSCTCNRDLVDCHCSDGMVSTMMRKT